MIATALSSPATERILYIEHHEDSRHMLAALLEYDGYEVVTANALARGLRLAMLGRFDLYVLDGRFKDGTGVDLCRQLRAFHPDTPIIFYSSLAYAEDIEAGMAAGAQHSFDGPRQTTSRHG